MHITSLVSIKHPQQDLKGFFFTSFQIFLNPTGQVIQQLQSSHESLRSGRVHKVKVDQIVDAEFLQLQHDRSEIGSQNLGIRVLLHFLFVGLFRVKPEAFAGTSTTSPTGTLR